LAAEQLLGLFTICHIAENCYQNKAITANDTVDKEGCIVMYCCVCDYAH